MWQQWRDYQKVSLERVELDLRIGAHAHEKAAPQPVLVDVELFREHGGHTGGGLTTCLDYDRIYRFLQGALPSRPHVDLLEEVAEEVVVVCLEDPRVDACRVTLRKPRVYEGSATPALEVFRCRRVL